MVLLQMPSNRVEMTSSFVGLKPGPFGLGFCSSSNSRVHIFICSLNSKLCVISINKNCTQNAFRGAFLWNWNGQGLFLWHLQKAKEEPTCVKKASWSPVAGENPFSISRPPGPRGSFPPWTHSPFARTECRCIKRWMLSYVYQSNFPFPQVQHTNGAHAGIHEYTANVLPLMKSPRCLSWESSHACIAESSSTAGP